VDWGCRSLTNIKNIASYNLTSGAWVSLPNQGLSSDLVVLAPKGTELYVGGDFGGTGDGNQYTGQIVRLGTYNLYIPLVAH